MLFRSHGGGLLPLAGPPTRRRSHRDTTQHQPAGQLGVTQHRQELLTQLGYRFGINGPHAARTMMLDDLRQLMSHTSPGASRADYAAAVTDGNALGKPTRKARELALRHLGALYALDPANPLFRALRDRKSVV